MTTSTYTAIESVQTTGPVEPSDVDYAKRKIAAALRSARHPVVYVRAKLSLLANPSLERPAIVQVNVDVDGRLVRAQVARSSMHEAIDEAHDRLRDRLRDVALSWEGRRGARPVSAPHEWRHTSHPTARPPYFPRPVAERRIVRHKVFDLTRLNVDEAVDAMETLDYDFYLFTEVGSREHSVLYHDSNGYRLAQLVPRPGAVVMGHQPVSVSPQRAPRLSVEDAVVRLDADVWPFVFFEDVATGCGCVLYHRYDGHYGLISATRR